ncbi:MAG: type II secretion system F family protein [Candidatus Nomurabacteria bacterium]|nr:MAG: type II secretion system F family protein [Candidatus Nomurabacteria bacterium]
MRKFNYEARDNTTDKVVKAIVQAETEHEAAKLLVAQGFTPLNIKEVNAEESFFARFTNRITTKDRVVFTRQLSTLITAGLPLSQSLRTLVDQTANSRLRNVIQEVIASVEGGHTLHDSFSKHPDVFDRLFLSLVAAGEASGTLDEALQRIAMQQEKDAVIVGRIRGAMTYPLIVLVVILAVMVFMLFTVVPQVQKLYHDLHQSLPLITQIIVALSQFSTQYWWLVVFVVAIIAYMVYQYFRTEGGQRMLDEIKLNTPIIKGLFQRLYMARFNRTGQTLLDTGVNMLDMLAIASEAVNNSVISDEIDNAAEKVKGGKDLSSSLLPERHVPELVSQMINIGEKSGRIDEMMGKTAKIYEDELDDEIGSISTAIEPVLMVVLAVVAGGMVAAILLPIYSLVNTMHV